MNKGKVKRKGKPIIESNMKRYTFFTYYERNNSYSIEQCCAKTLDDAEHRFVDLINLPYIKNRGKEKWHICIKKKWWNPLRVYKYKNLWTIDFIVRNALVLSYVKISEISNINVTENHLFTFALGCVEGGPFITQCEASNIEQAISIWKRRIPYQRYLSKEFRNYLKLSTRKRFVVEELSEMNDVYQLNWEGSNFTLYLLNN